MLTHDFSFILFYLAFSNDAIDDVAGMTVSNILTIFLKTQGLYFLANTDDNRKCSTPWLPA